ncbi:MAG: hypothetical protein ACKO3P_20735 [Planctomycetaceae bacterium]
MWDSRYGFNVAKLQTLMPRLLKNAEFCEELAQEAASSDQPQSIARLLRGETLTPEEFLPLVSTISSAFDNVAETVLAVGWDGGDFPGNSGGVWINAVEDVFVAASSDMDDIGPFASLDEALNCDEVLGSPPNPEISSDVLPLKELLDIAASLAGGSDDGTIYVNDTKYRLRRGRLVKARS